MKYAVFTNTTEKISAVSKKLTNTPAKGLNTKKSLTGQTCCYMCCCTL